MRIRNRKEIPWKRLPVSKSKEDTRLPPNKRSIRISQSLHDQTPRKESRVILETGIGGED